MRIIDEYGDLNFGEKMLNKAAYVHQLSLRKSQDKN